jgi:L-glyceraldehyde 3-phosphate reductase
MIIFSPLAQGLLTDRYFKEIPKDSRALKDGRFLNEKSITPEILEKTQKLNKIAKNRGQTLAQMALAWVLKDGIVTSVLIGASNAAQILDVLAGKRPQNIVNGI